MWLGPLRPIPTPSFCSAAASPLIMKQHSLQRLFQVLRRGRVSALFATGGGSFSLLHSGYEACGIPDGETIVMTGGLGHNHVTG